MNLPRVIIDAVLFCPHCGARHVDESRNGEKWHRRAHTTHRCQACGGDFDVYVSGQSPGHVVRDPVGQADSSAERIKELLERCGIKGVTTSHDTLTVPLALGRQITMKVVEEVK